MNKLTLHAPPLVPEPSEAPPVDDLDEERRRALAAHLRAVPRSRMLDYGAAPEEADAYAELVRGGTDWVEAGLVLAARRSKRAETAAEAGERGLAGREMRAAAVLRSLAQLALYEDTDRKKAIYAQAVADHARAAGGARMPWRRLPVPGAEQALTCTLVLPPDGGGPHPVVLVWGGASGWGLVYHRLADVLVAAGLAVGLVELPGQGEPRLRHHATLSPAFVQLLAALYAALDAHPALDAAAIGLLGNSVGGLLAARAAAADPRVRACCINGGVVHPEEVPERHPRQRAQWGAVVGRKTPDAIRRAWSDLAFDSDRHRPRCPTLVLHGDQDPLVALDDAVTFADAVEHSDVTLARWTDGVHCLYNVADERDALLADWFARHLG